MDVLTADKVGSFAKRMGSGISRNSMEYLAAAGHAAVAAMLAVKEQALAALRAVHVFEGLADAQLELLYDSMTRAPYQAGECIFEQGDVGDTFYVIIKGRAEVLRWEESKQTESVLVSLGPGAVFGERALLQNCARYATVAPRPPALLSTQLTIHLLRL